MALQFRPNYDKIVELLLYLAFQKPGSDKYQAVKFLYLADRKHINDYGRPLTFEQYYALPYGPVASTAKDLIEGNPRILRKAGLDRLPVRIEKVQRQGPDKSELLVLGEPLRGVDFDVFSKSDIRVFDEVLRQYGNLDFNALFRLTHSHAAYKKAWARRGDAKSRAMLYEEMIDSAEKREKLVADLAPIAAHL